MSLIRKLKEPAIFKNKKAKLAEKEKEKDVVIKDLPVELNQKVMILCSKNIIYKFRHLMLDIMCVIPHYKTDSKFDSKQKLFGLNEVALLKNCTSVLFFETRKYQDLYVWMAKVPYGPSIKFFATNIFSMKNLKLSGNHLKGSRPLLTFSKNFDDTPHWKLVKEVIKHIFVTPYKHFKSKPFFDHVISFNLIGDRIWFRNYQVKVGFEKSEVEIDETSLIEVGPRVTLQLARIFKGSFNDRCIYFNPDYVTPNTVRSEILHAKRTQKWKKRPR